VHRTREKNASAWGTSTMTAVDGCSTTLRTARRQGCLAALPSAASSFQLERLPSHSNLADASIQIITFRPGVNCFQKVPSPGCCAPRHEQQPCPQLLLPGFFALPLEKDRPQGIPHRETNTRINRNRYLLRAEHLPRTQDYVSISHKQSTYDCVNSLYVHIAHISTQAGKALSVTPLLG